MHPILWDLGVWRVTSYGLALTLGFALGIALGLWRARRAGMDPEPVLGVSVVIVISSIIGSRAFMLLTEPAAIDARWLDAVDPFSSGQGGLFGLSVMGGLPAALICSYIYLRWRGLSVLAYMDLLAPSVAFGAAVTRLGCLIRLLVTPATRTQSCPEVPQLSPRSGPMGTATPCTNP